MGPPRVFSSTHILTTCYSIRCALACYLFNLYPLVKASAGREIQLHSDGAPEGALLQSSGSASRRHLSRRYPPPPLVCKFLKTKKTVRKILDAWELRAKS